MFAPLELDDINETFTSKFLERDTQLLIHNNNNERHTNNDTCHDGVTRRIAVRAAVSGLFIRKITMTVSMMCELE